VAPLIDTLRLTAEDVSGLLERKEVSGEEISAAYRGAIDEAGHLLRGQPQSENQWGHPGPPPAMSVTRKLARKVGTMCR
jgi:hypothetical protein